MVNDKMPEYTVERIGDILNSFSKSLKGAKVLQVGVAYKQDIDDYRESPALVVGDLLRKEGCDVTYYDPYVPKYRYKGQWYEGVASINPKMVEEFDIVIVTSGHTKIDYDMIAQNAKVVFDTKNAMKNVKNREKIKLL